MKKKKQKPKCTTIHEVSPGERTKRDRKDIRGYIRWIIEYCTRRNLCETSCDESVRCTHKQYLFLSLFFSVFFLQFFLKILFWFLLSRLFCFIYLVDSPHDFIHTNSMALFFFCLLHFIIIFCYWIGSLSACCVFFYLF